MNQANLVTYLQDHLAGSVAALELLQHLISARKEGADAPELEGLKVEIESDQSLLKDVLQKLGYDEGAMKKAGAWAAEKALLAKLKSGETELGTLEALEVLAVGIEGKRRLWQALAVVDLGINLPELEASAKSQIKKVDALRMEAAQQAFK